MEFTVSDIDDELEEFERDLEEEELVTEGISEITSVGSEMTGWEEEILTYPSEERISDTIPLESPPEVSIDFAQFLKSEEFKVESLLDFVEESISNESDIIDLRLHTEKKRIPQREAKKAKSKKAFKDFKRELKEAIKKDYDRRLANVKEKRQCYNFLKTCSKRCIQYWKITNWKEYLFKEKDIVERKLRRIPIHVRADEIEFIKIRQGEFANIIFAKRAIDRQIQKNDFENDHQPENQKYIEVYKKYYMVKAYSKLRATRWNILQFIHNEKLILTAINFVFISHLEFFYQDQDYLYLGFPFIAGKSLRHYLTKETRLPEDVIKFYTAQLVLALEYLQFSDIIYRNLKPENVIVEPTGYIKLVGFMKAKVVKHRTFTRCFDLEYAPPELFTEGEYGKGADWWTLAVNIFELGTGFTPFESGNHQDTIQRITKGVFKKPGHFSLELNHLLERMLMVPCGLRAGTTNIVLDEIKQHVWFDKLDWNALISREQIAPLVPGLHNPLKEHLFFDFSENYMNEYFYEEYSEAEEMEELFREF